MKLAVIDLPNVATFALAFRKRHEGADAFARPHTYAYEYARAAVLLDRRRRAKAAKAANRKAKR